MKYALSIPHPSPKNHVISKLLRAYITRRQLIFAVLLHGEVVRLFFLQLCKKEVNGALVSLVVLPGFACVDKVKQRYEILFFLRGLVPDVPDERRVVQPLRL